MKNRSEYAHAAKRLAVTLGVSLLTLLAGAQQSGTAPKSVGNGSSSLPAADAGRNAPAAESSAKVVLKIGATPVTQSELEALFSERASGVGQKLNAEGRRHLAEAYLRMLLLSQQAVDDHLDASPAIRLRLETERIRTLAQAEFDKMRNQIQVSPDEIGKYYTDHALEFDMAQVREFLVRKRRPGGEEAEASGLSAEAAKTTAEAIRKALASGDSPDKIAEDFPAPDVLLIDRKPRTLHRNQMTPALEKATFEAKDGQVPEAVDTPEAVIVVALLKRVRLGQKDATPEIENKLRQSKLEAQIDDMKKKAVIWMDDDYFKNAQVPAPAQTVPAVPGANRK